MDTNQNQKRQLAQAILKELLGELPALTADILYQKLRDSGFTEFDAVRMTGACIRTASANGWMLKTNLCQNSVKNHSNLQKVWQSRLFKGGRDVKGLLASWEARGFIVPLADLKLWNEMQAQKEGKDVSV
jgi:hypothetical protein